MLKGGKLQKEDQEDLRKEILSPGLLVTLHVQSVKNIFDVFNRVIEAQVCKDKNYCSSVDRALQEYLRDHGFKSHSRLNLFLGFLFAAV